MTTHHPDSVSRRAALVGLGASGLALALGATARPAVAQEATPSASPIAVTELAPGVTAEVLSGVPSDRAPGQTLYTARFVFEPGKEIFPHSHPGTTSLTVYSGTFGWTLLKGTAYVIRGAAAGATEVSETLTEPNKEVILNPGDGIYYEDDVVHTARGAGDEPAVVYGSFVLTTGEPLLMPVDMNMGTPTS
jgi:quercetin dioxygenase-like cupin family protein